MRLLPLAWWKLSWKWLTELGARAPQSKKGLLRNSVRVAVIAHALSIGALSVSFAIVSGFQWKLAEAVSAIHGQLTYFTKWHHEADFKKYLSYLPVEPESAEIFWTTQALIVGAKGGKGVVLEGRRAFFADHHFVEAEGSEEVKITLGKPLADYLGAKEGDTLRLLLPGIIRGAVPAKVVGLISHGMYEIDSRFAAVDDFSLRRYLQEKDPDSYAKRPGDAHAIRFQFGPNYSRPDYLKSLNRIEHGLNEKLVSEGVDKSPVIRTWRDQKTNLFGAIEVQKPVISFILSLLVVVAAFNIAATLVVLFLERDREMAILQALGLSAGNFFQWICIQGFLLGLVSTSLGMLLGRIFGYLVRLSPLGTLPPDIYFFDALPLKYEWGEQLGVFAFGLFSALFVASLLAYRLSRVRLVEVLGDRR